MQQKHLLTRARKLRNESTPFEVMLWDQLRSAKLGGHKFRRQHVIDHCIVDFFCPAKGLIVEVDGDTHDVVRDAVRDQRHVKMGYSTIRFTNGHVGKNLEGVLSALTSKLDELGDRWSADGPHPAASRHPSPEGEGI